MSRAIFVTTVLAAEYRMVYPFSQFFNNHPNIISWSMSANRENDGEDDLKLSKSCSKQGQIALAAELNEYYVNQCVDVANLVGDTVASKPLIRFIRLNPGHNQVETLSLLAEEVKFACESAMSLEHPFRRVPWLDEKLGFYAIPGNFPLQKSKVFQSGRIYGMDVSSGATVAVLLSSQYDVVNSQQIMCQREPDNRPVLSVESLRVLDLCCAPGLKLCALADMMMEHVHEKPNHVRIIGVDISQPRLAICKRIVTKYHVDPDTAGSKLKNGVCIQLYCGDGTTFGTSSSQCLDLQFDSTVEAEAAPDYDCCDIIQKRKRKNKSARARERKRLRQLANEEITSHLADPGPFEPIASTTNTAHNATGLVIQQFDRVLVDAECSTDGSIKHILKRSSKPGIRLADTKAGSPVVTSIPSVTDAMELTKLVQLQRKLIESGFRLLKPGGFMVYSTCSLSQDQNENVVSWLLERFPKEAFLVPVKFPVQEENGNSPISDGSLAGTVRFQPNPHAFECFPSETLNVDFANAKLFGDGFYLAKIGKTTLA